MYSHRQQVIDSLEMYTCVLVSVTPDRPNIFYEVKPRSEIGNDLANFLTTLREHTIQTPQVIVYCTSLNMCANLYTHFHYELGSESYYPLGAPQLSNNRLFGMFHANTPQYNKDVILRSLQFVDGIVQVIFATVALGMGINLQGVNQIIHYGTPQSLEDYFQKNGRGGRRSGDRATSVIYWKPADCPVKSL